jgi:hypothetical protein
MRRQLSLVLVSLSLAAGCSPRDFLTHRLATDLIVGSNAFKTTQQYWLRTGIVSNKDFTSPEYLVLQHSGWITGRSTKCPVEIAPPPCWDVVLTPLGVETFRDLISGGDAQKQYFSMPTARRELVGITGISKDGSRADVDFVWKWVPTNEVGAALYAGGLQYKSTVAFRHYDDGWRIIENASARTNQDLDEALKNAEPAPE